MQQRFSSRRGAAEARGWNGQSPVDEDGFERKRMSMGTSEGTSVERGVGGDR